MKKVTIFGLRKIVRIQVEVVDIGKRPLAKVFYGTMWDFAIFNQRHFLGLINFVVVYFYANLRNDQADFHQISYYN